MLCETVSGTCHLRHYPLDHKDTFPDRHSIASLYKGYDLLMIGVKFVVRRQQHVKELHGVENAM